MASASQRGGPVDFWSYVLTELSLVPVGEEDFFKRLWANGRLRFRGQPLAAAGIQELSARILATAIRRQKSLFVQLPQETITQAPALFASALLLDAIGRHQARDTRHTRVVLFGSSVALRGQLTETTVSGLSLSSVFSQVQLEGDARRPVARSPQLRDHFPEVVCALSPASPRDVLHRYRPTWIAVDGDDGTDIDWLPQVLAIAHRLGVPVIGWLSGYFGVAAPMLSDAGIPLLTWPPVLKGHSDARALTATDLVARCIQLTIQPVIVRGEIATQLATLFNQARQLLARLAGEARSPFFDDCLRSAWQYLRALEALHVPLSFYEAECQHYWGMVSLASRRAVFDRFINSAATIRPAAREALADVLTSLDQIQRILEQTDPPLWSALLGIAVADARSTRPLSVILAARARKRLFELALLGIEGITTSDLASMGVSIKSLADLVDPRTGQDADPRQEALAYLVGLPREHPERLQPLLRRDSIRILILPHQEPEVQSRVNSIAAAVTVSTTQDLKALQAIGLASGARFVEEKFRYVTIAGSDTIDISGLARRLEERGATAVWAAPDAVREAQWLLSSDEEEEDATAETLLASDDEVATATATSDNPVVEGAMRVELSGGRIVLLDPNAPINVMRGSGVYEDMQERPANAIRRGDRIVLIHGQKRQSLYDLLISRVHNHHAIRLHLALLKLWHEEIDKGFHSWARRTGRGYEALLQELRQLGCRRSAPLTLRFWVSGEILCPSDPEDIRRAARVLEMTPVLENSAAIARAAERIRGLHRGLAHRLNNWLRNQNPGNSAQADDVIDEELGLRLSDFRESLEVLVVENVTRMDGIFLRSSLNRVVAG